MFRLNLLLTISWVLLTGELTAGNLLLGLLLSAVAIGGAQATTGRANYFRSALRIFFFLGFFLYELVAASLRVAAIVLAPRIDVRPGVVAIPLDLKSDLEITLLANMITLTPGTLTLDISDDRSTIYVHAIDIDDVEQFKADIKSGFEQRIRKTFR